MVAGLALSLALQAQPTVLDRAHSHNDYRQARPLLEALDNGFSSVEADLFLVDGKLLVGHDRKSLKPERTFDAVYLKPLADRLKANGGWVYPKVHKTFWVLVDQKADGLAVYEAVKKELAQYPELAYKPKISPVRFVISGDRPIDAIVKDKGVFAGLDGRWEDIEKGFSPQVMPWISEDWTKHFNWKGVGPFTPETREKLKAMSTEAHGEGYLLRFWGAPDLPSIWKAQWDAGVNWLNADNLNELRKWMLSR
jgi:hypothetical protein